MKRGDATRMIRRAAWPAVAFVIVGTFAGHAIAGPNGLLAWRGYSQDLDKRKIELAQLQEERARLKHRSELLNPRKADPDMADELIRRDLGLVRADEVIVPLED